MARSRRGTRDLGTAYTFPWGMLESGGVYEAERIRKWRQVLIIRCTWEADDSGTAGREAEDLGEASDVEREQMVKTGGAEDVGRSLE